MARVKHDSDVDTDHTKRLIEVHRKLLDEIIPLCDIESTDHTRIILDNLLVQINPLVYALDDAGISTEIISWLYPEDWDSISYTRRSWVHRGEIAPSYIDNRDAYAMPALHQAHHQLLWISCIYDDCRVKSHLSMKLLYDHWPARVTDQIVTMAYYNVDSEHYRVESTPSKISIHLLSPRSCRAGGSYERCQERECSVHRSQKVDEWHDHKEEQRRGCIESSRNEYKLWLYKGRPFAELSRIDPFEVSWELRRDAGGIEGTSKK